LDRPLFVQLDKIISPIIAENAHFTMALDTDAN